MKRMKLKEWKEKCKHAISLRSILVTLSTLIVLAAVSATMFGFVITKDVTIIDRGQARKVTTTRIYVEELLAEQGITLNAGDRISDALGSVIKNNDTIEIERGKKIVLTIDGGVKDIFSCEPVLKDALDENGIVMNQYDEIEPYLETPVTEGMNVQIRRILVFEETRTEVVPKREIVKPNPDKSPSYSSVISEGRDGSATVVYKVITRDGVEASRDVISKEIITESVDRVVEKGTMGVKTVAASTSELPVKKVLECTATAYTASAKSNGIYAGKTASGRKPNYGVVAVDPRVIPMGTKLYIESLDGSWTYGYAVAGDTGGAIKGNKIDLFFHTESECYSFGRRKVRVYVLE